MSATSNDNLDTTTASYESPTNASDEMAIFFFHNGLFSIAWHIHRHSDVIYGTEMDTQIGKGENEFYLKNLSNRNSEYVTELPFKKICSYQNTKLKK